MKQLNIFEQPIITENNLTPRQWKLYDFFKTHDIKGLTQQQKLEMYEEWLNDKGWSYYEKYCYGYFGELELERPYNDMTSARQFRKDIQALQDDVTIQKVITDNGIASDTSEAEQYLSKMLTNILKRLKRYHTQKKKLEKHLQTRLVFNQEKDLIEAVRELL